MSTKVLLRERPHRAVALATSTHVLVFRHSAHASSSHPHSANASTTSLHSTNSAGHSAGPRCIVELSPREKADLSEYRAVGGLNGAVHGTLGLITLDNDVFLCVVAGATKVATVRPGETVQKILSVEFHCLNKADYDNVLSDDFNPYPSDFLDDDGHGVGEHGHGGVRRDHPMVHPCMELKNLLSDGSFYYSVDIDLTSRLQERSSRSSTLDSDSFDQGYLWNSYMIKPLVDFRSKLTIQERDALDSTRLLTSAIRGFASTITIPSASSPIRTGRTGLPSTLTLISRLSCRRAGTRFNSRGIDDDGNVANFVETEIVFWAPSGISFSYAQIRGSVPVFWEQAAGFLPGQQKIQLARSAQATQPAFNKHFEELEMKYGLVHVVNLLSREKHGEVELSERYRNHVSHSSLNSRQDGSEGTEHRFLRETDYDFHAETRGPSGYDAASGIKRHIEDSADGFGYCLIEAVEGAGDYDDLMLNRSAMLLQQQGVFRTNCLDCLDRTNLVQTIISLMAIDAFLHPRSEKTSGDFVARHSTIWADNGDALSKIYAGTGALKSSFTRSGKMSIAGALADARKSATRMYINNFADKGRQNTIDMLLGRLMGQTPVYLFDPINDFVTTELARRYAEYSSSKEISIWAGTLNLNGRDSGLNEDLSPWICPSVEPQFQNPDIVAVGFQEMVELSPQQIMSTEPTRRQHWEKAVKRTLNSNAKNLGAESYVLLRGGQLVGAALSIYVKSSLLQSIKNVEGSLQKTGMSGMAGNKGAVAIRLNIDNTSLCFVTAHLAAGFANYEERNRDYKTISQSLRFQHHRLIDDHDTVIWMGDFNYRIGLSDEKVRRLVKEKDLGKLYENDQLNLQMVAGLAFPYYSEARISFPPTYKYNIGTDDYDTSEKARIPAWTDRILRKGHNLRQHTYTSPQSLRFSDHRPVSALFTCTISAVDAAARARLSKEIYAQRRAVVGDTVTNSDDDDDLLGYEPVRPGLPPASSDRKKWWLDGGLPARSTTAPPQGSSTAMAPNPLRPSNPFTPSSEPDWVSVPTPSGTNTSTSTSTSAAKGAPRPASSRTVSASTTASSIVAGASANGLPAPQTKPKSPPVPRKPVALTTNAPAASSPSPSPLPALPLRPSAATARSGATSGSASLARSRSLLDNDDDDAYGDAAPTLPPRRDTSSSTASASAAQAQMQPQPQPQPQKATQKTTQTQTRGLMDDEGEEEEGGGLSLSGWVPLRPS